MCTVVYPLTFISKVFCLVNDTWNISSYKIKQLIAMSSLSPLAGSRDMLVTKVVPIYNTDGSAILSD